MKRENEENQDSDQHHDGSDNADTSDKKPMNKRSRKDEEEVRLLIPSKVKFLFFVKLNLIYCDTISLSYYW